MLDKPALDKPAASFQPHGVYAASVTPLNADLSPDLGALTTHSRWLLENGCDGLGVLGTTGEANSIGFQDRLKIIAHLARAVAPERLMPGVGSCALADALTMIRACLDQGVANVLCLPPFFYKPLSDAQIEAWFAALLERANDDRLRLHLYHIPQFSGVGFSVSVIAALRRRFGDMVAGVKDSSGDFSNMRRYAQEIPGFRAFAGSEQFLGDILAVGGVGCISATTNLTSREAQRVFQERSAAAQEALTPLRLAIQAKPLVPAIKGLLARMTGVQSLGRMLPPHLPLSSADIDALDRALKESNFKQPVFA